MKPSQEAIDINDAHRLYRAAIGTPFEGLARAHLEAVVLRIKRLTALPVHP